MFKTNPVSFLFILLLFSLSCNSKKEEHAEVRIISNNIPYSVKLTIPHDEEAFTQGLVIHEGKIYESTGRENSYLAEMDLQTGEVKKKVALDKEYFGEGISIINNKLYQLTWKSNIGFIYDLNTLERKGTFSYKTEGWGLTNDGHHLIMSDGSDKLYYLDTLTFGNARTVYVKENTTPVRQLNELEFYDGFIYANQWETNYIYKIDPATGKVTGKINLSPLVNEIKRKHPNADVLNGIAYNKATGDFLVTGKLWPRAYWIKLQ